MLQLSLAFLIGCLRVAVEFRVELAGDVEIRHLVEQHRHQDGQQRAFPEAALVFLDRGRRAHEADATSIDVELVVADLHGRAAAVDLVVGAFLVGRGRSQFRRQYVGLVIGAANADGGRGGDDAVPGAIGASNPAADHPQRPGEQAHAETVRGLVLRGEALGDKIGAGANGHHPRVVGLEDGFGQGGGAHPFADMNHVAFAQLPFTAAAGCGHVAADAQDGGKGFAVGLDRRSGLGCRRETGQAASREEEGQPHADFDEIHACAIQRPIHGLPLHFLNN